MLDLDEIERLAKGRFVEDADTLALVSRIRELDAEVARLRNERDILAASIDWAGAGGLAAVDGALDKLMDAAREYLAEKEKAR